MSRRHHLALEDDAVVERRQRDHPVVVGFENSVAVADPEGRAHDSGFADLGGDVADFDDIGGRFLGDRSPAAARPEASSESRRSGPSTSRRDRRCSST